MKIAIAGLGWLGIPLSKRLQELGHTIKGSTTNKKKQAQLNKEDIDTYLVDITEDGVSGQVSTFLEGTELIIILIPPGLRKNSGHDHALRMLQFLKAVESSGISKSILISSTGVYDDSQGNVDDNTLPLPQDNKGRQLLEVERLFIQSPKIENTVIRFGGLFGGSRNPVKYLAGRKDLTNGNAPVNLIHRKDCLNIILAVIAKEAYGITLNAVAPQHPLKKDYYTQKAIEMNLKPPLYKNEEKRIFKQVDSVNVNEILEYSFEVSL